MAVIIAIIGALAGLFWSFSYRILSMRQMLEVKLLIPYPILAVVGDGMVEQRKNLLMN